MIASQTAIESKKKKAEKLGEGESGWPIRWTDGRGGAGGGGVANQQRNNELRQLISWLNRQGVRVRELVNLLDMVNGEKLTTAALEDVVKSAEYLQDVQVMMKADAAMMKQMLQAAVVMKEMCGGQAVMTPQGMAELAALVVRAPKMAEAAAGQVEKLLVRRQRLSSDEVVATVLSMPPWKLDPEAMRCDLRRIQGLHRTPELSMLRGAMVYLLRHHTVASFPEINVIVRGHREGHSTSITAYRWIVDHWNDAAPLGWHQMYATIGTVVTAMDARCGLRYVMPQWAGVEMEVMRAAEKMMEGEANGQSAKWSNGQIGEGKAEAEQQSEVQRG